MAQQLESQSLGTLLQYMEFYENEYVFDPNKNSFIPIFWVREVDDVYSLWQHGYENIPFFLLTSTALIRGFNGLWS